MCVALAALEARRASDRPERRARIPFAEFHRLPGDTPQIDRNLRADEIITAVELPRRGLRRSLHLPEDPRPHVLRVRPGLGRRRRSISTAAPSGRPASRWAGWRTSRGVTATRRRCSGARATRESFSGRPRRSCGDAQGFGHNDFKIELARRAIVRALTQAAEGRRSRSPTSAWLEEGHDAATIATSSASRPHRVDGRAKVTGEAKYAAEFNVPNLAHGWVVSAPIAKGRSAHRCRPRR